MSARSGFQVGGAVQQGALYVERRADRELLEALRHGEFCYILAPRQIVEPADPRRSGARA